MIDAHAHILSEYYDDLDVVIEKIEAEMLYVINSGFSLSSSREAIKIASKTKNMMVSVGIHPTESGDLKELEQLLDKDKVVAVGEIGLDYYHKPVNKDAQKMLFRKQMDLALKHNLPVVIHNRDADQDVYNILKEYPAVKGFIHCYGGSLEMAKLFVGLGYKIGIGGVLTFKNSNLWKVVAGLDINDILVETDAPYLTPEPFRGQKNHPLNVSYIYSKIAEIKDVELKFVQSQVYNNVRSLFDF